MFLHQLAFHSQTLSCYSKHTVIQPHTHNTKKVNIPLPKQSTHKARHPTFHPHHDTQLLTSTIPSNSHARYTPQPYPSLSVCLSTHTQPLSAQHSSNSSQPAPNPSLTTHNKSPLQTHTHTHANRVNRLFPSSAPPDIFLSHPLTYTPRPCVNNLYTPRQLYNLL